MSTAKHRDCSTSGSTELERDCPSPPKAPTKADVVVTGNGFPGPDTGLPGPGKLRQGVQDAFEMAVPGLLGHRYGSLWRYLADQPLAVGAEDLDHVTARFLVNFQPDFNLERLLELLHGLGQRLAGAGSAAC